MDNYCNSFPEAVKRIEEVTEKTVPAYKVDARIKIDFLEVFGKHDIDCVIHFAGLKAVGRGASVIPSNTIATISTLRSLFLNV